MKALQHIPYDKIKPGGTYILTVSYDDGELKLSAGKGSEIIDRLKEMWKDEWEDRTFKSDAEFLKTAYKKAGVMDTAIDVWK